LVNLYEQEREGIRAEIKNIGRMRQESEHYESPTLSTDFRMRGSNDVVNETINHILTKMADTDSRTGVRYTAYSNALKNTSESVNNTKRTTGLVNYDSEINHKQPNFISKSHKFKPKDEELDNPFRKSQSAAKNRYNADIRHINESSPDENENENDNENDNGTHRYVDLSSRPAGVSSKYGKDLLNIFHE
jgi:hypothetical protein